jgi:hypothetical protein
MVALLSYQRLLFSLANESSSFSLGIGAALFFIGIPFALFLSGKGYGIGFTLREKKVHSFFPLGSEKSEGGGPLGLSFSLRVNPVFLYLYYI